MGEQTVFDDVVLRQLEQQYKGSITKIYCSLHGKYTKCWTGFVISKLPMIIVTVSHAVREYNINRLQAKSTFHVKFYADFNYYPADLVKCDFQSDLLLLTCPRPVHDPSPFSFVDPDLPFSTSTSLFSISHASDRPWRVIRGSVCSPPFFRGEFPSYHHDLIQFDHDVQLYPGGSGAPLIDLMGRVRGIQSSEIAYTEHAFCVEKSARKRMDSYTSNDVASISRTINEMLRPSNLKQATPVHELANRLREMFVEEEIDPDTGLTCFLRQAVNLFILKKNEAHGSPAQSPSPSPSQSPSPATSSAQDPGPSRRPSKKPRLHERNGIPVATEKEASQEDNILPSEVEPLVLWQPEDCEGGDNDLATVAGNPLFVKYLGPRKGSRAGMVEQDEVSLANVNCQSDQEDVGAFAGITGCLHMLNSSEKQIWMVLDTKEKMITKRDPDGLLTSKPIEVNVVRANTSSEIDGATGFQNLGACVIGIDSDHQEKDPEITQMAREKHLEQYSPGHTVQEKELVALR